jgi:DNA mismatch repair protein MutL
MASPDRIRILSDEAVNKVAAGEVVERPAAALKELLENSIDAGARHLEVALEGAGRTLIRVRDDGEGMSHDEVLLALERHSTSKIGGVEDLDRIATFGFRGEALPSLAAVSKMRITTRTVDESEGTRVLIDGGRVLKVTPWGAPRGTEIEVRSLFRNVPARLKFLKSTATELSHCVGVAARLALAHPGIDISLTHGKRSLLRLPAAAGEGERLRDYLGEDFHKNLLPFQAVGGEVTLRGFIARPGTGRPGADYQQFFVNRRPVRDYLLQRAIRESCRNYFLKEREPPSFFIWIDLPPGDVDVNVHPTKREVRFRNLGPLRSLVEETLRETLKKDRLAWFRGTSADPGPRVSMEESPAFRPSSDPEEQLTLVPKSPEGAGEGGAAAVTAPGQLFSSYLVSIRPEGLLIVDQHAAHERIHYERILANLQKGETQRLLHPTVLDLSSAEAEVLEELIPEAAAFGIEVESFGPRSYRITALPPDLPEDNAGAFLRDLIERARSGEATPGVADFRHRLAAVMACHASVRAKEPLAAEEARALLKDLYQAKDPAHCPHGRPTFIRLEREEIEKRFKRT